ncbi:glycosyltransferase [Furfurilactobacillus curtus]|uniref:Poly(Glycerol-phosphate) alpha-glucosyltransferase n=1 Tax=Furfurilactobacillus curtus TaxID=1746200 RepID=A0ABQ5JN06_9LACO
MNFFLNDQIVLHNSGIEHAEFDRLRLFNRNGQTAQIVTRNYSRQVTYYQEQAGLKVGELRNMFNFFQEAEQTPDRPLSDRQLPIFKGYEVTRHQNFTQIYDGSQHIAEIRCFTYSHSRVDWIRYFDRFGNVLHVDYYDWRGFLSMTQRFNGDGQVNAEWMFNPRGKRVYESYYQINPQTNQRENSLLKLIDYHGRDLNFANLTELFRFFLDELNQQTGKPNIFISDRRIDLDEAMLTMHTPATKLVMIHSTHSTQPDNQVTAPLNSVYETALVDRLDQVDGLIVQTQAQRQDLLQRLAISVPIYVIPSIVLTPTELSHRPRPLNDRPTNRLLCVARRFPEKRLDQAIIALKQVRERYPDATLELRGYGTAIIDQQLHQLVDQLGLVDAVQFTDYTTDLTPVYESAQILLLTSETEGFARVLPQAQAHGLPIIAYDIHYGPREIIDQTTGVLVSDGNVSELATAINELLAQSKRRQSMSQAAIDHAQQYGPLPIWRHWQELLSAVTQPEGQSLTDR